MIEPAPLLIALSVGVALLTRRLLSTRASLPIALLGAVVGALLLQVAAERLLGGLYPVRFGGLEVPATTTRMAETTVELGSGQSMMIAGLLSNSMGSSVEKVPGAGDIPVLGALFKSNGWRRNETELMIVITPYLVKPVSDSQIVLPTDGLNSPNDLERILLGKVTSDKGEKTRPMPTIAPTVSNGPELGSITDAAPLLPPKAQSQASTTVPGGPGFSFDN